MCIRDRNEIYLLGAPALEVVNEALRKGDTALNIRPKALWEQCRQRGWLLSGDVQPDGGMKTSRTCWLDGHSVKALVFSMREMLGDS